MTKLYLTNQEEKGYILSITNKEIELFNPKNKEITMVNLPEQLIFFMSKLSNERDVCMARSDFFRTAMFNRITLHAENTNEEEVYCWKDDVIISSHIREESHFEEYQPLSREELGYIRSIIQHV